MDKGDLRLTRPQSPSGPPTSREETVERLIVSVEKSSERLRLRKTVNQIPGTLCCRLRRTGSGKSVVLLQNNEQTKESVGTSIRPLESIGVNTLSSSTRVSCLRRLRQCRERADQSWKTKETPTIFVWCKRRRC